MKIKLGKTVKDFYYLLFSNAFTKIFSLFVLVFLTRQVTKEELSLIPMYGSLCMLSTTVFNLGFYPLAVKIIPPTIKTNPEKADRIAFTIICISIISGILITIFTLSFHDELAQFFLQDVKFGSYLQLMSIGFFFSTLGTTNDYIFRAYAKFKQQSKLMFFHSILNSILLVVLTIKFGAWGMVVAIICGTVIKALLGMYFLLPIYLVRKFYSIKELFSESWSFYLESYLIFFRSEGDTLIVGSILGPELLSVYYIAKRILIALNALYQNLFNVVITKLSSLAEDFNSLRNYIQKIFELQVSILLPGTFIYIALVPWLVLIIGGYDYAEATLPAILLVLVVFINHMFYFSYWAVIYLTTRSINRLYLSGITTITLLPILYLLCNSFSIIGVATAYLLSIIITTITAHFWVKKLDKSINLEFDYMIKILLLLTVTIGPTIIFQLIDPSKIMQNSILLIIGIISFIVLIHVLYEKKFYTLIDQLSPISISNVFKKLKMKFRLN